MTATITRADTRLARQRKTNILLVGPPGVGKTFQASTLPEHETLFLDLEAGMSSIERERIGLNGEILPPWQGDAINVRDEAKKLRCHPWEFARAVACLLSGYDPAVTFEHPYSQQSYSWYSQNVLDPASLEKYKYLFVDSITVASRMAFAWAKQQPQSFSEKTGKPDNRGAYGLLGQEMITWATQLQHIQGKSIVLAGILDKVKDDYGRFTFELQIDGTMAKNALPGIFDNVMTLGRFTHDQATNTMMFDHEKGTHRALICKENNPFGVPAKDRHGALEMIEAPDLGAAIRKIQTIRTQDKPMVALPAYNAVDTVPMQPVPTTQQQAAQ